MTDDQYDVLIQRLNAFQMVTVERFESIDRQLAELRSDMKALCDHLGVEGERDNLATVRRRSAATPVQPMAAKGHDSP